jgi:hypothetical protein
LAPAFPSLVYRVGYSLLSTTYLAVFTVLTVFNIRIQSSTFAFTFSPALPQEAMFSKQLLRPVPSLNASTFRFVTNRPRFFSSTTAIMVQAGDPIPAIDLVEDSPGNIVSLRKELTGNGLIIGVPAAFSVSCSY